MNPLPSPLFISLKQTLEDLRDDLLDLAGTLPTRADGNRAMAFVLLASAAVEGFVEKRGIEVAREGVDRFASGRPTRTGRALLIWYLGRTAKEPLPLRDTECGSHSPYAREALDAYENLAGSSHGIDGKDLRKLVMPIGLDQVPLQLIDNLNSWADVRNPNAHARVPRATRLTTPKAEWARTSNDLLPLLELLDASLSRVCSRF